MPSQRSLPSPIASTPALGITKANDEHRNHRFFLGPMPQRVVTDTEHLMTKPHKLPRIFSLSNRVASPNSDEDDPLQDVIQDYAFKFFLEQGGREEQWGEEKERSVRQEMLKKWRESEWGRMWRSRKKGVEAAHSRWVGGSFEIGDFLGVNVLDGEPPRSARSPLSSRAGPSARSHFGFPSSAARESLNTARTHPSTPGAEVSASSPDEHPQTADGSHDTDAETSMTSLLRPSDLHARKAHTDVSKLKPPAALQTKSDGILNGGRASALRPTDKGKGRPTGTSKVVRVQSGSPEPLVRPSEVPARPSEVLNRTGGEIHQTSAAATEARTPTTPSVSFQEPENGPEIVMQDRMVVRVGYSGDESLGPNFDEQQHRSAQHLQYLEWREFMVVWRKSRVELYEDYTIPYKEVMTGHKHLSFIAPLKHVRSRLSLYSFADLTFCLLCPPTPVHSGARTRLPFQRKGGTYIFIFKVKSRSRAADWMWRLWRFMGGQLPPIFEIRSPVLDTRVKIDVPDTTEADDVDFSVFNRDNLIRLCTKTLSLVPDYDFILKQRLAAGARLELAWRLDTKLDWVWWLDDIDGSPREWAVLAGLAYNQAGKAAHLEVRIREHLSSHLHLKDGRRISEPPGIEGYVDRIKPATQTRQAVYLTIHNGLLFTLPPSQARPPHPPGTIPPPLSPDEDYYAKLRADEVKRGAAQVATARGVTDLRAIVAIRRAFQVAPIMSESVPMSGGQEWEDEELVGGGVDGDHMDEEDVGGEEGLVGRDAVKGRMRRCFELVMKTGRVIRFETYSAKIAIEWIERLRELVRYWKMRHRIDTRQEMDVVHFATGRPRITPHRMWHDEDKLRPPEPAEDANAVLPYLSSMYNWCVFDGCRPITKSGRIFVRKGIHGQYVLVQLFLVSGRLVQYHIKSGSAHHRRTGKTINLIDAYTASGWFAAQALPVGQYNPNTPVTARRYQDGLESDDLEEDTLFMVYYFPHNLAIGQDENVARLPALNSDRKLMVFRTRSRVERDVWCWAINTEIEKLARARREREARLRNAGNLAPL